MMWVATVTIEADEDPGYELVTILKERFGQSVRTQTKAQWLIDAEKAPVPPMGKVSPNIGEVRQGKLRRGKGSGQWQ